MIRRLPFAVLLTSVLAALSCAAEPTTLRVMSYDIHHGDGLDQRLDLERIATGSMRMGHADGVRSRLLTGMRMGGIGWGQVATFDRVVLISFVSIPPRS